MTERRIVTGWRRWAIDLTTGFRFALSGGRSGVVRTLLTTMGVGLAVALLLMAASLPTVFEKRDERAANVSIMNYGMELSAADDTMVVNDVWTDFGSIDIRGFRLQPDGSTPPVPPGLTEVPAPGELAVSPALASLLESPEGKLLQPRFDYSITQIIGDEGLIGPSYYVYYLGTDDLVAGDDAYRIDHIGNQGGEPLPPMLLLLGLTAITILLLSVVLFVGVASRFGSESRDRRLAALRLIGADRAMARRVAAGEALLGAVFGLIAGLVFFLIGRQFVEFISLWEISVFATDVNPMPALIPIIFLMVPFLTVGVTWLSMRKLIVEPLGVFRQAQGRKRQVWWRIAIPVVGLAIMAPVALGEELFTGSDLDMVVVPAGVVLLLVGVAALLPWVVEVSTRRMRGGPVPWQLAIRRVQLGGDGAGRAVAGIAVAAAGAIALQMLFTGAEQEMTMRTGISDDSPVVSVSSYGSEPDVDRTLAELGAIDGFTVDYQYNTVLGYTQDGDEETGEFYSADLVIGDCEVLRQLAEVIDCRDGDVFAAQSHYGGDLPPTGMTLEFGDEAVAWVIPDDILTVRAHDPQITSFYGGILATPSAVDQALVDTASIQIRGRTDASIPGAIEHVRNLLEPTGHWQQVNVTGSILRDNTFDGIRRGILVGVLAVMTLIGLSLIVGMLEQLQERRRLLSILSSFGTRRSTLGWSILWQMTVPVVIGLLLAMVVGSVAGLALMKMAGVEMMLDWSNMALMSGMSALTALLVTLLSLPVLWRLMRSDGLRTE
ncbi:FtsX-like permease family protein [Stackebrandtia endophytica]|uniref:FtsX-like permease family protein n=1 Tax=Stackebrandtia endophytica TaxID=1496996 RepID=A0A543B3T7_9ACTN|nr:FtsX-like permease family protein [Stackebrandtia endophytica]TQL79498.1 FtsX-like permease family protein [Stackebrandtia endophytica]